jgi:UPF0176 protein
MTFKVAALYKFVALPDAAELQAPLLARCEELGVRGTLLLAREGINGTIAAEAGAIQAIIGWLHDGPLFGDRLRGMDVKYSSAEAMPFGRMKVRLKREIVTLKQPSVDPTRRVGTYVEPEDWNSLVDDPDVVVIDTRNAFEVAMGTMRGALDPGTRSFSEFPDFVARTLDPAKHPKVAMFCTGGIRCEKASSYMLAQGFKEVYHLKGGILRYLETMPENDSRWQGGCFVFDERVSLGHGLVESDRAEEMSDAEQ